MMDLRHLVTYLTLLFYLFFILIAESATRPSTDFDTLLSIPPISAEYLVAYPTRSVVAKDTLLSRLRRGYYYIDENEIRPVNPLDLNRNIQTARRRQDSFGSVKNVNNRPKKLFVPNLFG